MTDDMLAKVKNELATDPKQVGYADAKSYEDKWWLFNCHLVPFFDEMGNEAGWTSRAQLLLKQDVTLDDVIDAIKS